MAQYSEETFCIDLIGDYFKIDDPYEIKKLCKEYMEMDISLSIILDYLGREDDYEQQSKFVQMKDIFYE